MAIEVHWFPTLIKRTRSKQATTSVDWASGLTPLAIFTGEGFNRTDAEAVMVVVNESQVELEHALQDGDSLEFMVSIQGGM
jgi:sulfur carrier protein ThiS